MIVPQMKVHGEDWQNLTWSLMLLPLIQIPESEEVLSDYSVWDLATFKYFFL